MFNCIYSDEWYYPFALELVCNAHAIVKTVDYIFIFRLFESSCK